MIVGDRENDFQFSKTYLIWRENDFQFSKTTFRFSEILLSQIVYLAELDRFRNDGLRKMIKGTSFGSPIVPALVLFRIVPVSCPFPL